MVDQSLGASFRDPSGFLFTRDGRLYRQVNQAYRGDYDLLHSSGLYDKLVAGKLLVSHQEVCVGAAEPSLALIHHLAISNNVPLERVVKFFSEAGRWLIIEFVPKEDSQVKRLLSTRQDIFPDYTFEGFETAFKKILSYPLNGSGPKLSTPHVFDGKIRKITQVVHFVSVWAGDSSGLKELAMKTSVFFSICAEVLLAEPLDSKGV